MRMNRPAYHDLARASMDLALPWHSVATEIADLNFHIVTDKLNKHMKSCNPARPWSPKDFFSGLGYHTHNLKGYVPKPESLVIPSRPPPAVRTAEDQPFYLIPPLPNSDIWTCSECRLHINVLEFKAVVLALHHWVSVLQGHQVMIATENTTVGAQGGYVGPPSLGLSIAGPPSYDTTDNTTVVAYINKQGGTPSHIKLRLVVDLFLWLQDIPIRARHIPGCTA